MKYDKLFSLLLREQPEKFFELIGRSPAEAKRYRFAAPEVKEMAFRFDCVFEALSPKDPTYFVEVQFQHQPDFYERVFAEFMIYIRQNHTRKWKAVIIYPNRAAEPKDRSAYWEYFASGRVKRIFLDEVANFTRKTKRLSMFKAAVAPPEKVIQLVRRTLPTITAKELDFIEQIFATKFPTLTQEEIRAMLGLKEELFKDTQFYKDVFGEGKQEGKLDVVPVLRRLGLTDSEIAAELNIPLSAVQSVKVSGDKNESLTTKKSNKK
jgi:predicted transposase/invertase (TIGR01784 family)